MRRASRFHIPIDLLRVRNENEDIAAVEPGSGCFVRAGLLRIRLRVAPAAERRVFMAHHIRITSRRREPLDEQRLVRLLIRQARARQAAKDQSAREERK